MFVACLIWKHKMVYECKITLQLQRMIRTRSNGFLITEIYFCLEELLA